MKRGDRVIYHVEDGPRRGTIEAIDPHRWSDGSSPAYYSRSDVVHENEAVRFWVTQFEIEPLSAVELLGEIVADPG